MRQIQSTTRTAIALAPVRVRVAEAAMKFGGSDFSAVTIGLNEKQIFAGEAGLLGNGLLSHFPGGHD